MSFHSHWESRASAQKLVAASHYRLFNHREARCSCHNQHPINPSSRLFANVFSTSWRMSDRVRLVSAGLRRLRRAVSLLPAPICYFYECFQIVPSRIALLIYDLFFFFFVPPSVNPSPSETEWRSVERTACASSAPKHLSRKMNPSRSMDPAVSPASASHPTSPSQRNKLIKCLSKQLLENVVLIHQLQQTHH